MRNLIVSTVVALVVSALPPAALGAQMVAGGGRSAHSAPPTAIADVPPPRIFRGLRLPAAVESEEQFVLEVVDDLNRPIKGARVSVKPDTGCGTVVVDTAHTDGMGHVGATWKMGHRAGVCSAVAQVVGSKRFPRVLTVVTTNGAVGSIKLVRGANQTARFGTIVPDFFEIQVFDKYGNIARNARIRFSVVSGGGRLVDYAAVPALTRNTNLKGMARVFWRLGPGGKQVIMAKAVDSPDAPPLLISATGVP